MIFPVPMGNNNAYLIKGEKGYILVDAGLKGSQAAIYKVLQQLNAPPRDIKLIIATHSHHDHTGGMSDIRKETGAPVLAQEEEAHWLRNGKSGCPQGTVFLSRVISFLANTFLASRGDYDPVDPDILIKESFSLEEYGVQGKVIHTPGHTQGSVCVILEEEGKRNCICGDTFFNVFPVSVYPLFADDEKILRESWKKIRALNCSSFYPGHGKNFSKDKFEKTYQRMIK
jgi:glyoxylase-like metal-dependent hydrolase (beta-lactamase superfamily II)